MRAAIELAGFAPSISSPRIAIVGVNAATSPTVLSLCGFGGDDDCDEESEEKMVRTLGSTLIAGLFLVAGLSGFAAAWAAWPRTAATSPLMALIALAWGCTYTAAAVLTWRRSRFAAPVFVAAIALLLLPARFLFPGGQILVPALVVLTVVASFGHRYLRRTSETVA